MKHLTCPECGGKVIVKPLLGRPIWVTRCPHCKSYLEMQGRSKTIFRIGERAGVFIFASLFLLISLLTLINGYHYSFLRDETNVATYAFFYMVLITPFVLVGQNIRMKAFTTLCKIEKDIWVDEQRKARWNYYLAISLIIMSFVLGVIFPFLLHIKCCPF